MPEKEKPAGDANKGEPAGGGAAGPPEGGREAPFVANIVNDPNNPPDALLLTGFVGRASDEGYTRLYLNPELNDYVDIPNASILYIQSLSEEESPLGASYIWIQRDAELLHGKAGTNRLKASFFEGRIARDFAGVGGGAAGAAGAGAGVGAAAVQGGVQAFPNTVFSPQCQIVTQPWWGCQISVPYWRCIITQPARCRTLIDPDCLQVTPPWQLTITPVSVACGIQTPGNFGDLGGGLGAGGFGGNFGGFAPQGPMAAQAPGAGAGGPNMIPRSDFAPCRTDWGPQCAPTTPFDGCPPRTSLEAGCPPPPTTPQAWCPQPTTPQAGCPQPTSVQAGCPQPTTPNAGCPQPTSVQAGCPQPTSPQAGCPLPTTPQAACPHSIPIFRCNTVFRPQCVPSDFGPCATDWGPRCQSQLLVNCPSQVIWQCQSQIALQCQTINSPICFGPATTSGPCLPDFGQQGLGQQGLGGIGGGLGGGLQPQGPNIPNVNQPNLNIQTIPVQACQVTQPFLGCPPRSLPIWQCPTRFTPFCPPSQILGQCPPSVFPVYCPPSVQPWRCPPTTQRWQCPPSLQPWQCPTQPILCGQQTLTPDCLTPLQTQVCNVESFACGPQQPVDLGGGFGGFGGVGGPGGGGQVMPQGPMGGVGAMLQPGIQQGAWAQSVVFCHSQQVCPTQTGFCITAFNCPTVHRACQSLVCSQVCPSVGIACQSVFCTQICPSAVDACPSSLGCTFTDPGTLGDPGWGQGGFGGIGGLGGFGGIGGGFGG